MRVDKLSTIRRECPTAYRQIGHTHLRHTGIVGLVALWMAMFASSVAHGQSTMTPGNDASASPPSTLLDAGGVDDNGPVAPADASTPTQPAPGEAPAPIPDETSNESVPSAHAPSTVDNRAVEAQQELEAERDNSAANEESAQHPKDDRDPRSPEAHIATHQLKGQETWDWTALPIGTFSPATQLGLGAFGALLFRLGDPFPNSRPSSIAAVGLLTTRRQAIFELISELYWDHDRTRLWSKLDYRYYPNAFWGIGPRAPDSQKEWYVENGPRWQLQLRHIFYEHLYLEGRVDAQFARIQDITQGGLLDSGSVLGSNGKHVIGIGPTLGWDSRDHSLEPHTGGFYELSLLQFHKVLFSQFTFTRLEVNLRRYFKVANGQVFAMQLYGEFAFGDVPFYRLPQVGGQRMLRSYFEGRFRDKAYVAAQAEYRMFLFWRIGAVAFVSAGDVGPSIGRIPFSPLKWSVGGGLRLRLNEEERLNLRADLGFGYDSVGFNVGIAEAF